MIRLSDTKTGGVELAQPKKITAEWFPFYVRDGRTLFALQKKYGLAGIGFFTQTFRYLGQTPSHFFCFGDEYERMRFIDFCGTVESECSAMLTIMANTGKIDKELWEEHDVVWSIEYVESLKELYRRRRSTAPTREFVLNSLGIDPCDQDDVAPSEPRQPTSDTEPAIEPNDDIDADARDDGNMSSYCRQHDDNMTETRHNNTRQDKISNTSLAGGGKPPPSPSEVQVSLSGKKPPELARGDPCAPTRSRDADKRRPPTTSRKVARSPCAGEDCAVGVRPDPPSPLKNYPNRDVWWRALNARRPVVDFGKQIGACRTLEQRTRVFLSGLPPNHLQDLAVLGDQNAHAGVVAVFLTAFDLARQRESRTERDFWQTTPETPAGILQRWDQLEELVRTHVARGMGREQKRNFVKEVFDIED